MVILKISEIFVLENLLLSDSIPEVRTQEKEIYPRVINRISVLYILDYVLYIDHSHPH